MLNVRKLDITAHNSRSDDLVLRHMGILKFQLQSFVNMEQNNRNDRLAYFSHACRTTVNARAEITPYFMMYDREARSPNEEFIKKCCRCCIRVSMCIG